MLASWGAGLFTAECERDGTVDGPPVGGALSWGGLEAARSADIIVVGAGCDGGVDSSRSDAIGGAPSPLAEGAGIWASCCDGRPEASPSNGGDVSAMGGGAPLAPLLNVWMTACKSTGHTDSRAYCGA